MTIALLAAEGLVFLLWAALAFRLLFRLRAQAAARSGRMFPGPAAALSAIAGWLRDPATQGERRAFGAMTALLVLLITALALARP